VIDALILTLCLWAIILAPVGIVWLLFKIADRSQHGRCK
jgi:hypothetical protein